MHMLHNPQKSPNGYRVTEQTYKSPTANTADTPAFRCQGKYSFQIEPNGKRNVAQSVSAFVLADAKNAAPRLIQRPSPFKFQILLRGVH